MTCPNCKADFTAAELEHLANDDGKCLYCGEFLTEKAAREIEDFPAPPLRRWCVRVHDPKTNTVRYEPHVWEAVADVPEPLSFVRPLEDKAEADFHATRIHNVYMLGVPRAVHNNPNYAKQLPQIAVVDYDQALRELGPDGVN